jgi:mRNA-degrading endonuclease toxin of MazEF toxin-antitoxin module
MMFSNWVWSKYRPVAILSEDRWDYLVSAISTQIQQWWPFDIYVKSDDKNKLRSEDSVIRLFKLSTISWEIIKSKWGHLSKIDRIKLKENMKKFAESW